MRAQEAALEGRRVGRSVYGFEPRSVLAFTYLREGSGEPLDIIPDSAGDAILPRRELLIEWLPHPGNPLWMRLYTQDSRFGLWVEGSGLFVIDPAGARITVPAEGGVRREERLWGIPAVLSYMHRGDRAVHGAAVDINGEALLLAGPGRAGKSTLAAAFLRIGARVLSEDLTCVRLDPLAAVPGPAMLRVRRDVLPHLGLDMPVAFEDADRVSLMLDARARGSCHPVPLRAVVFLRESTEGIFLRALRAEDGLRDLWALSFRLPTDEDRSRCFRAVARIAEAIPFWNVFRPRTIESLRGTVETIVESCLRPR